MKRGQLDIGYKALNGASHDDKRRRVTEIGTHSKVADSQTWYTKLQSESRVQELGVEDHSRGSPMDESEDGITGPWPIIHTQDGKSGQQDDFTMMEDETSLSRNEICYGALCEVTAGRIKQASDDIRNSRSRFMFLDVILDSGNFYLTLDGTVHVAVLDMLTAQRLRSLQRYENVRYMAVVEPKKIPKSNSKATKFEISLNILGPDDLLDDIGEALGQQDASLEHPFALESGTEYINAQYFHVDGRESMTHLVGISTAQMQAKKLSDDIEGILASLDRVQSEEKSISLLSESILVALTPTQRRAIQFMLQRENAIYCEKTHRDLRQYTGSSTKDISESSLGGVLADVMGLGKTLTALGLIVQTKNEALAFGSGQQDLGTSSALFLSKATLVVAPSLPVMEVWADEVKNRLREGTLQVQKFHGPGRAKLPTLLLNDDVVLTTYATLSEDFKRKKILSRITWFRIVLDEAHCIRNRSSKQFKACRSLDGQRRWCLTGTPIQNRLDDLASLVSFLRLEPFDSPSAFQKQILQPLETDSPHKCRNIEMLLRSLCLRRDASHLNLPEIAHVQVSVHLSTEERAGYKEVAEGCRLELERQVSQAKKPLNQYNVLFTAMHKLRRYCNSGTMRFEASNTAVCETCDASDADAVALLDKADICPDCGRTLAAKATPSPSPLASPPAAANSATPSTPGFPTQANKRDCTGHSSKLASVVERLCGGAVSDKNIVFSYWTATLDILEELLSRAGISALRIDGAVPQPERLLRLDRFRQSQDYPVLLMTVGTGAVGLNLTAANKVHVVEPQWNPSVEEQAIARAARMGQKRPVTVFRYVVKNSVEQNIVNLQKKKRHLAKFTLDRMDETVSGKLDDLKFVVDVDDL